MRTNGFAVQDSVSYIRKELSEGILTRSKEAFVLSLKHINIVIYDSEVL